MCAQAVSVAAAIAMVGAPPRQSPATIANGTSTTPQGLDDDGNDALLGDGGDRPLVVGWSASTGSP